MKAIILLKGLPGSGKTTWAKSVIDASPNVYKRVNKDDLRAMIDNSRYSKDAEKFILEVRDTIIIGALERGKHVIVDDTNLHPKHEKRMKEIIKTNYNGRAKLIIQDFTDVPLGECIKRDSLRPAEKRVGKEVIIKMYNQFIKPKIKKPDYVHGLPEVVICDLDGTLALLNGRNPYDASTCEDDGLNNVVAGIIRNHNIIFVSGREEKYMQQTENFLKKHGFEEYLLFMRKTGDMRKDAIIKEEIYNEHIRGKYNVKFVLDDRNQVVEMWRSLGLVSLQVAEGDF